MPSVPCAPRRRGAAAAVLAAIALWAGSGATGRADPPPPAPPVAAGPTFSLTDMGATAPLTFFGDQGSAELVFPVPRGLTPVALTGVVEIPVNVRAGTLTVMQRDRMVARIPLPPGDQAPVVIPLAGAEIVDDAVAVTLRTYLMPVEGYCLDPTNPLRLNGGAVNFAGVEAAPISVAEFLPPLLRKLTIAIPPAPTAAESDAAVQLAASVAARYGQQPTAVVLAPLGPALPPAGPFERQVVIEGGPDAGITLQPVPGALPNLRITGPQSDITNQARLLTSDLVRLSLSSKAVAGPLAAAPQLPGDVTTLGALGQPVVSAVALAPQVAIGLDQTRLGRPVRDMRVHLLGSYTPVPAGVSARLVAVIGGQTIDSWSTDERGLIDRWVDIPNRLVRRYTTLGVGLNVAGNTGRCGEFQPLTLTIDGDSVVHSDAAVPPVPAGLQSVPQALMPRVEVGIPAGSFDDATRAVTIVVVLQRLSARPIDTAVTSVEDALASSGPAIVIAADGWKHPDVALPIGFAENRFTLDGTAANGRPTTVGLDGGVRYGTVEAFFDGRRSLLVATSNSAPEQLDELLGWMSADVRRWSQLDGTAVIAAAGQQPVVVGGGDAPTPEPDAPATGRAWWPVGGAVAALAAVLVVLRSRRRAGEPDDR